jgi:hypothetical protein
MKDIKNAPNSIQKPIYLSFNKFNIYAKGIPSEQLTI